MRPSFTQLAKEKGVIFPEARGWTDQAGRYGMDAALQTVANTTVPVELLAYVSPEVIEVLFAPRRAREIFTEERQGDWTTPYAKWPVKEFTGKTSPYADFSQAGRSKVNYNWPMREQYVFQTIGEYGDLEQAMSGVAKVNLAADIQASAAMNIDIDGNRFQFYGVSGKDTYGLLNDPNLPATLNAKATGTGNSTKWADKTTRQIYEDILALFAQLQTKSNGLITQASPLVLCVSPAMNQYTGVATDFNISVTDMLNKYFSNIRIVTVPELASQTAGDTVMLIATEVMGRRSAVLGVSDKIRALRIVPDLSSFSQKFVAGTYGAVVFYPFAFASMTGVAG